MTGTREAQEITPELRKALDELKAEFEKPELSDAEAVSQALSIVRWAAKQHLNQ